MDLMDVRREMMGVVAAMASGAQFAKGTFTIPADYSGSYTLDFGKTFSKYLFYIELTEDSKTAVINSGTSNYRPFCWTGSYPSPIINNSTQYGGVTWTYQPSSGTIANGRFGTTSSCTSSSISFSTNDITGSGTSAFMKGCSYNYYIVEIK